VLEIGGLGLEGIDVSPGSNQIGQERSVKTNVGADIENVASRLNESTHPRDLHGILSLLEDWIENSIKREKAMVQTVTKLYR
jgi:hypothetical protein